MPSVEHAAAGAAHSGGELPAAAPRPPTADAVGAREAGRFRATAVGATGTRAGRTAPVTWMPT